MFTDEELKPFGWARGGYWMRCKVCGDEEVGVAKRSLQCRCCASQAALAALRAKLAQVEQERDGLKRIAQVHADMVGKQATRAEAAEQKSKHLQDGLEIICALVMKYDIPPIWEAREEAQKSLIAAGVLKEDD